LPKIYKSSIYRRRLNSTISPAHEVRNNGNHEPVRRPEGADRLWQRDGVDQSCADYGSPADNIVRKQLTVGSTVLARLHDDRDVEASPTIISVGQGN
jgi:hypothetical protein